MKRLGRIRMGGELDRGAVYRSRLVDSARNRSLATLGMTPDFLW
jgi:hypothetical protein